MLRQHQQLCRPAALPPCLACQGVGVHALVCTHSLTHLERLCNTSSILPQIHSPRSTHVWLHVHQHTETRADAQRLFSQLANETQGRCQMFLDFRTRTYCHFQTFPLLFFVLVALYSSISLCLPLPLWCLITDTRDFKILFFLFLDRFLSSMMCSCSFFFYYFFIFCFFNLPFCHARYLWTHSPGYASAFCFVMEGCRYSGMQCRSPEASQ